MIEIQNKSKLVKLLDKFVVFSSISFSFSVLYPSPKKCDMAIIREAKGCFFLPICAPEFSLFLIHFEIDPKFAIGRSFSSVEFYSSSPITTAFLSADIHKPLSQTPSPVGCSFFFYRTTLPRTPQQSLFS